MASGAVQKLSFPVILSNARPFLEAPKIPQRVKPPLSSTRQAVMRGPSFTGFGKRPDLTPTHQVDLLTGIGPFGARIEGRRTKPVSGKLLKLRIERLRRVKDGTVLCRPRMGEAEFG